jgi:putative dimethyl sulfoxide reductase chaperone
MLSSSSGSPTPSGFDLDQAQLAQARSYSYRLFSQLYAEGLTAVLYPYVQKIPELTAVCPQPYDPDVAAASYHDLFQFNVFAYESFFLSDDGLMGGRKTAVVAQHISQRGYSLGTASTDADHLGVEISFLAFLAAAEADAWEDNLPMEVKRLRTMQQTFLQTHLLRWGVSCLLAIQEQADPFFAQLAILTLSLLLAHQEDLAETAVSPPPNFLPATQDILAKDKTGFKEIVRHFITPAFSGIILSRYTIGQLARQLELPRGFGNREQMMLNLMRTAVQYESLPQLLQMLQETAVKWQNNYQDLITTYPKTANLITPWQQRAKNSDHLLTKISSQA